MFTDSMAQVAQGELEIRPMAGRMAAIHSFKALQSNLKHLTWKTQQIAAGDLEQKYMPRWLSLLMRHPGAMLSTSLRFHPGCGSGCTGWRTRLRALES